MSHTKTNDTVAEDGGKRLLDATQTAWKAGLWNGGITKLVRHYKRLGQPISRQTVSLAINSGYATDTVRRLINDYLGLENELYV
ncbi:MAG TPA: hypothetical protein VEY71_04690 [Chitinophagales bacterium]|nr:hypothetical protein [Chitinophagales bacterium]